MRLVAPILAVAFLFPAGELAAGEFDDMVAGARRMSSGSGLGALFWSRVAGCSQKSDYERRQCEAVRSARRSAVSNQLYLIDGSDVLDVAGYDAKKKSVEVTVRSCLSCDDKGRDKKRRRNSVVVVGKGNHRVAKGNIIAAPVSANALTFEDKDSAEHWAKYIAPRLKTQFLVKIPDKASGLEWGTLPRIPGHRGRLPRLRSL